MAIQPSLPVVVSVDHIHAHTDAVIARAASGTEHFVVEQNGEAAVIMSKQEYDHLTNLRAARQHEIERRLRKFDEIARSFGAEAERRNISEDDALSADKSVRKALFKEQYGEQSVVLAE